MYKKTEKILRNNEENRRLKQQERQDGEDEKRYEDGFSSPVSHQSADSAVFLFLPLPNLHPHQKMKPSSPAACVHSFLKYSLESEKSTSG